MNNKQKIHTGIYGLYVKDNAILMIKKNRGPYMGKLDLPGGSIEFGETLQSALKRELLEETASTIKTMRFLSNEEYMCQYTKDGTIKDFHHIGIYYTVDLLIGRLNTSPDGHDSDGAIFIPLQKISLENTSPIAYKAIQKILIHA